MAPSIGLDDPSWQRPYGPRCRSREYGQNDSNGPCDVQSDGRGGDRPHHKLAFNSDIEEAGLQRQEHCDPGKD